jgi:DNA-binding Lrp family transcriptional regulator
MAVIGFILINAQTGMEHDVQGSLSSLRELTECYAIHKEYDFLVTYNADNSSFVHKFVDERIKTIAGVIGIKIVMGYSIPAIVLKSGGTSA